VRSGDATQQAQHVPRSAAEHESAAARYMVIVGWRRKVPHIRPAALQSVRRLQPVAVAAP
jgi:hypothetical protein